MPGLVRKLLIFAAVDGLVLQPATQKGQRPAPATKIAYKDKHIGPVLHDTQQLEGFTNGFEAFGIVGMSRLSSLLTCILISIRSLDGVQKFLPDIDYEERTGCANTRKADICNYWSSTYAVDLESRSGRFN